MTLLEPEDLAYMRETQAEARPVPADLKRRVQGTTASGGRTDTYQTAEPVNIRLDGKPSRIPDRVAELVGTDQPVKITMDLVECRAGDVVAVTPTEEYVLVTDSDPDRWATAQVLWARRTKRPARTP